jgi:hypothetical protein
MEFPVQPDNLGVRLGESNRLHGRECKNEIAKPIGASMAIFRTCALASIGPE